MAAQVGRMAQAGRWSMVAIAVGLTALVTWRLAAFASFTMRSAEMAPAVEEGDWVLVDRRAPHAVGDVVAVRVPPRSGPDVLIRRVVATGADEVVVADDADGSRSRHPAGAVVGPEVMTSRWPLDRYLVFVTAALWLAVVLHWRARRAVRR